ncbi:MAG: bifunctional DNA-formamidopyrimidine glycosylase/DNA-(apurinic or apyrimidinic site) lyase [Planctomycetota bacterium]
MPELPEVETMVRGIRRDCSGRMIRKVEFVRASRRPIQVTPERKDIRKLAEGRELTNVCRIAKRVVLVLDSAYAFVVEPRMTGLMLISDPPTQDHRRVVWHFAPVDQQTDALEFWDRRGLGTVSLLSPDQLESLRNRFGPDALAIDQVDLHLRLKKTSRAIKVALLDQSLVAGIGNLYASEILHHAGISPRRRASSLTKVEVARLVESTHFILNEAIRYEGSTLGDGTYRNALSKDGGYQNHHRVYQRAGEICPACGDGMIQRIVQTQRSSFFCPNCQR